MGDSATTRHGVQWGRLVALCEMILHWMGDSGGVTMWNGVQWGIVMVR